MTVLNKAFSILTRGKGALRDTDPGVFSPSRELEATHSALVPDLPGVFLDYAAEQIIRCLTRSIVSPAFQDFDPVNLYKFELPIRNYFSYSIPGAAPFVLVSYNRLENYNVDLDRVFDIRIDADNRELTFLSGRREGEILPYGVDHGLSDPLRLDDQITIRTKSLTGVHDLELTCHLPFNRTLLDVSAALPPSAAARYQDITDAQIPDYLAAVALDVCVGQETK